MDHNFSQVAFSLFWFCPRPVGGFGWLSTIASSVVALDPDCLTSPSLSLRFPSQPPLLSSFAPHHSGQIHAVGPTSLRWGQLDRQIPLVLHHTLRQGSDAEPGIWRCF
jgi:hypothetical protein